MKPLTEFPCLPKISKVRVCLAVCVGSYASNLADLLIERHYTVLVGSMFAPNPWVRVSTNQCY